MLMYSGKPRARERQRPCISGRTSPVLSLLPVAGRANIAPPSASSRPCNRFTTSISQLASVPNRPYFTTVTTSRHIDVKLAARFAGISDEEFRFLNPAHNKPVIKADGSETIVLPIDRLESFQRNLESHDQPLATWQTYTMKRNDKPEAVAAKFGMTLAELKEVNGITGRKRIVPGQTLLVPHKGDAEPHLPDLPAPKVTTTRYRPKVARCVQVRNGVRKVVNCPAAKKKPAARQPVKQDIKG